MNKFRNKFEQKTGDYLTARGVKYEYETEKLPYVVEAKYIPDFIITTRTGNTIHVETKGNGRSFDGPSRRKLVAVQKQHPNVDLRLVFYSNGNVGPKRKDGSRLTQGDWATKNGFKWAIRDIPQDWLDE